MKDFSTLKMEALNSSEMLLSVCQITQHQIQEDGNVHNLSDYTSTSFKGLRKTRNNFNLDIWSTD
jgi:hypothetical protein